MILQALSEYYDRRSKESESNIAPEHWEWKEIPFVIVLDNRGTLIQVEDTREKNGEKTRAKAFLVPQAVKRTSGIAANLLWDSTEYVYGIGKRGDEKKKAFIERLRRDVGNVEAIKTLIQYLEGVKRDQLPNIDYWDEISKGGVYLSFRLVTDRTLMCQRSDVMSVINEINALSNGETSNGICLVTGEQTYIKKLHTSIKGIPKSQTSGANIVSFNLDAFRSYGKEKGLNAPVGTKAEFAYTTALNELLGKDSKQKILIGDAQTVFWSKKPTSFETDFSSFFEEPHHDDPASETEKIKVILESVKTGAYLDDTSNTEFYILGLSPNNARISIRFWQVGTIAKFAERIKQYFDDFAINKPTWEPEYYSIKQILKNVSALDDTENIPPNLSGDLMRAILSGIPYPATLLQAAIRRIHSDAKMRVKPVRAAVLNAYLNSYYRFYPNVRQKEISMSLDVSQPSIGYHLGRLFAALEKIQEEANPNLNATIRDRYYGAACATPVSVFPTLLRLKNHHLAKLENKGSVVRFEQLIGEIMGNFTDFPAHLGLHEQGRFAIGYYHQRQYFFTKKTMDTSKSEQAHRENDKEVE